VPNIKENYIVTYEYLKGIIQLYVYKNNSVALRTLINIIHKNNIFMPAYFSLWDLIKSEENYKFLLKFSLFTIKTAHSNCVETQFLVRSYYNYSKALVLNNENDDAIKLLLILLDNYAPIKCDDIKFLKNIYKDNKITHKHGFQNFEEALKFYSKNHIVEKVEPIFKKYHRQLFSNKKRNSEKILSSLDHSDQITLMQSKITSNNDKNEIQENNEFMQEFFLEGVPNNAKYCITDPQFSNIVDDINLIGNNENNITIQDMSIKKEELPAIDESIILKEDYDSECSMIDDLQITEMNNFEAFIDKNLENFNLYSDSPCKIIF
jgi:hypothetical protein